MRGQIGKVGFADGDFPYMRFSCCNASRSNALTCFRSASASWCTARGVPAPKEVLDSDGIEARSDLVQLGKALGPEDMMLLEAVGIGHEYPHLAAAFGSNGAALRARVSRCRRVGRVVLAY